MAIQQLPRPVLQDLHQQIQQVQPRSLGDPAGTGIAAAPAFRRGHSSGRRVPTPRAGHAARAARIPVSFDPNSAELGHAYQTNLPDEDNARIIDAMLDAFNELKAMGQGKRAGDAAVRFLGLVRVVRAIESSKGES